VRFAKGQARLKLVGLILTIGEEMTPAEHCCYRLIRLMAAPQKFIYIETILGYRDADGVSLKRHIPGMIEAGYVDVKDKRIMLLK
jgi:hypothetical protein